MAVKRSLTRIMRLWVANPRYIAMTNQRSFGRRAGPQSQSIDRRKAAETIVPKASTKIADAPMRRSAVSLADIEGPSVDDELREWKRTRKSSFRIPWRPLSLMASLCFGIASLVLPDWVNSAVQWPLYGLAAASLYVGFAKRRGSEI